jgi:hypothetical protein
LYALEPDLRRRSPHMLIAWSRVLAGRFTDPLVGRDVLIGILAGAGMQFLTQLGYLSPAWLGQAPDVTMPFDGGPVTGLRHLFSILLRVPVLAVLLSTALVLLVFLLTLVLRRRWLVAVVFCSLLAASEVASDGLNISLVFSLLYIVVLMFVMMRVGLLSFIVSILTYILLDHVPMTFDPGVWYSGFSWIVLAVLSALAFCGFRVALAGRPVFEGLIKE